MARSFSETACQPHPGRSRPHSLGPMLASAVLHNQPMLHPTLHHSISLYGLHLSWHSELHPGVQHRALRQRGPLWALLSSGLGRA